MALKRKFFIITALSLFLILLIISPEICTSGAHKGILISGNVIIPSLFPVTVLVLMILKNDLPPLRHKSNFFFGQTPKMFFAMIMSMLGGYPMGAKIIDEMSVCGNITDKQANYMLMYCINAGPAFIIIAVGSGILNSKILGYILCISHIISSLLIAAIVSVFLKDEKYNNDNNIKYKSSNIIDAFVLSTAQAAKSVLNICAYVILFSVINSYIEYFAKYIPIFNYLSLFTEVTSGVTKTNNIILISFLLGFSGISVWCQIFSLLKNIRINKGQFVLGRILHGLLSSLFTLLLLKVFNITKITISNGVAFSRCLIYNNVSLTISLTVMTVLFIIFLHSKNIVEK